MNLSAELEKILGEESWQFYNCYKCHDLISAIQLAVGLKTSGIACACGSMKVQPTQINVADYPRLNVIEMAVHLGMSEDDVVADFIAESGISKMSEEDRASGVAKIRSLFAEVRATCN